MHIPDGYLSAPDVRGRVRRRRPHLGGRLAQGDQGRPDAQRAPAGDVRGDQLPRDDVQHPDPGRDDGPRRRRCRDRGGAGALGGGDRGIGRACSSRRCCSATAASSPTARTCFNMAIVMPFVGFGVYRLVAGRSAAHVAAAGAWPPASAATSASTRRRWRRRSSSASSRRCSTRPTGRPLYSPYHLSPDDPRDGARAPHRGRRGRGDPDRRCARLPAARQRAPARAHNHPGVPVSADARGAGTRPSGTTLTPARVAVGFVAVMVAADAARPARAGRRLRRGRPAGPRPRRARALGGSRRARPLQRVLEPHAAGRVRVRGRREREARLLAVGAGRHRGDRAGRRLIAVVVQRVAQAGAATGPATPTAGPPTATGAPTTTPTRPRPLVRFPPHDRNPTAAPRAGARHPGPGGSRATGATRVAAAGRAGDVPVRVHRQAQEGLLRREDPRPAARDCCGR